MTGEVDCKVELILAIGPRGSPITGQSIATDTWVAGSKHRIIAVNNNFEGMNVFRKIIRSLEFSLDILGKAFLYRPSALYLSIKRSTFGSAVDLICVILFRAVSSGPIVIHLHGADLNKERRRYIPNLIIKTIGKEATDSILLSPRMAEQLKGISSPRIHIIPNFSEMFPRKSEIAAKMETFLSEPLRILYLSNLIFSKGYTYLMSAVRSLRAKGIEVTLTLAGKPLDDEYMTAAEAKRRLDMELCEGINFIGTVRGSEKWDQLLKAHVIALPTFYRTEAQPLSLIEGMAFGCIPLTTQHNYNEDFLDPNAAIFVEKQSSESIEAAILDINNNRDASRSRAQLANSIATNCFQVDRYVNEIDSVFVNALNANHNI